MQSQPLQNLGATANLWLFYSSTKFSSKPGGFLVFSDALSILELYKLNQKLYLVSCIVFENEEFYVYFINFGYVLRKLWVLEVRISNLENLELWVVMPRGNRPSLQTGELDKTIIFPLSTLSVLRDNDAVVSAGRASLRQRRWECIGRILGLVEIELPAPNALPTSAESSRSNSSTWLELLFYKPSDVRAASSVCWEGFRGFLCVVFHVEYSISKIGSAEIVRGDDVCWLHAFFRAKTAGGPGGGVTSRLIYSIRASKMHILIIISLSISTTDVQSQQFSSSQYHAIM
uniref:Uncharacterized protein n=1 Tax=Cucumis melo TaxID=3656 RepID=A0A9I9EG08_CUCME